MLGIVQYLRGDWVSRSPFFMRVFLPPETKGYGVSHDLLCHLKEPPTSGVNSPLEFARGLFTSSARAGVSESDAAPYTNSSA